MDPITLSAVNRLKPPIGSLVQVSAITDPSLLATGSTFNTADYPKLATAYPTGFQADYFDEIAIGDFDTNSRSTTNEMGILVGTWTTADDLYFIFVPTTSTYSSSNPFPEGFHIALWRSKAGRANLSQGIEMVRRVFFPEFPGAANGTISGSNLYLSSTGGVLLNRRYDLNDLTFQTWKNMNPGGNLMNARFVEGNGIIMMYTLSAIFKSTNDGDSWTAVTVPPGGSNIYGIAFGNNLFVAVTAATTGSNIHRTADGAAWTSQLVGAIGYTSIAYLPTAGRFVAMPFNSGAYYTSTDGITFTASTSTVSSMTRITATATGGLCVSGSSQFLVGTSAVGASNRLTTAPFLASSGNPVNALTAAVAVDGFMIAFAGSAGGNYQRLELLYSTNSGNTWSTPIPITRNDKPFRFLQPAICVDKTAIALLEGPDNRDGTQAANVYAMRWHGALYANDAWTKFQINTTVAVQWLAVLPNPKTQKGFLAYGVISGGALVIANSADGLIWNAIAPGGTAIAAPTWAMYAVTGEVLTMSGTNAVMGISTNDGSTFITRATQTVTVGGVFRDRVIMVNATAGKYTVDLLTFPALNWTPVTTQTPSGFAADNNKVIITCRNSATFYYSFDGTTFVTGTLPSPVSGLTPAIVNDWVIVPTGGGSIYRSKDFINWELAMVGEDTKYVTDMVAGFSESTDASVALGITQGKVPTYVLKSQSVTSTVRRIPKVQSSMSNVIWAVVAK